MWKAVSSVLRSSLLTAKATLAEPVGFVGLGELKISSFLLNKVDTWSAKGSDRYISWSAIRPILRFLSSFTTAVHFEIGLGPVCAEEHPFIFRVASLRVVAMGVRFNDFGRSLSLGWIHVVLFGHHFVEVSDCHCGPPRRLRGGALIGLEPGVGMGLVVKKCCYSWWAGSLLPTRWLKKLQGLPNGFIKTIGLRFGFCLKGPAAFLSCVWSCVLPRFMQPLGSDFVGKSSQGGCGRFGHVQVWVVNLWGLLVRGVVSFTHGSVLSSRGQVWYICNDLWAIPARDQREGAEPPWVGQRSGRLGMRTGFWGGLFLSGGSDQVDHLHNGSSGYIPASTLKGSVIGSNEVYQVRLPMQRIREGVMFGWKGSASKVMSGEDHTLWAKMTSVISADISLTKNSPTIPLWVGRKLSMGIGVKYEVLQGAAELKDTIPCVVSVIAEREWIRQGMCTTVAAWFDTGGGVEGGRCGVSFGGVHGVADPPKALGHFGGVHVLTVLGCWGWLWWGFLVSLIKVVTVQGGGGA
ncbi:hypothetical protein SCLCIDRAFT_9712 [Scleroderma citrinum Foug A]|uniref:Uncharacterized protein n=1 Tax=Scleroderma citrinum Foug A TaxID=1036808 RepID=A0A0C2ZFC5_9AGAM|nr:hypothetical protein SCLCIDRAFT_9712 [Scleroderma citrinum Foug A]